MKTGKNETQNMGEMIADMKEAKEKGLSITKGRSVYKQESGEYQEEKLKELISKNIIELADIAVKEKISLEDTEKVKERTFLYLKACEETGTFPTSLGFARSLGYSDRALRQWRSRKENTPTAQWLDIVQNMCADILNQSALKNNANSIVAIFLNKALYEMKESNEIVLTPGTREDEEIDVEEIRKRYLIDEYEED